VSAAVYGALSTPLLQRRLQHYQEERSKLASALSTDYAALSSRIQLIAAELRSRGVTPDLHPC
jgi:hypothetical protein